MEDYELKAAGKETESDILIQYVKYPNPFLFQASGLGLPEFCSEQERLGTGTKEIASRGKNLS